MIYKLFVKNSSGSSVATEPNYQLANELHRQIIRKSKRRKVSSSFRDNIWACAIDLFSKYAWGVVPMKDKSGISIVNAFQKII